MKTIKNLTFLTLSMILTVRISFAVPVSEGQNSPDLSIAHVLENGSVKNMNLLHRENNQDFVLIEFSSVLCKGCVQSLPKLADLAQRNKDRLQVHLVYIDKNVKLVEKFINDNKEYLQYPVALDPNKIAKNIFGVEKTPTLFLVDKHSKVVLVHEEVLNDESIARIEDELRK